MFMPRLCNAIGQQYCNAGKIHTFKICNLDRRMISDVDVCKTERQNFGSMTKIMVYVTRSVFYLLMTIYSNV